MGPQAFIQVRGGTSIITAISTPYYVDPKVLVSSHCFDYLEIDWASGPILVSCRGILVPFDALPSVAYSEHHSMLIVGRLVPLKFGLALDIRFQSKE